MANGEHEEPVEVPTELVPSAEMMGQVQVARAYPRKLSQVTERMVKLATMDQETAESCFYTLKRKDRRSGETKKIQGPSIRLAEIGAHCYGNVRWGGRMVREEERQVICEGAAHDLENNNHCQIQVGRRITTSSGQRYGDDMVAVTSMAAIAICLRNAVLKIVPAFAWKPAYEAAIAKAVGDASTLADRRQKMIAAFAKMGIGVEKILAYCEKKTLDEIGLEDLADLIGAFNAIREGEQTVDQVFGTEKATAEPMSKAEAAAQPTPPPSPVAPEPPKQEPEQAGPPKPEMPGIPGPGQEQPAEATPELPQPQEAAPVPPGPTTLELQRVYYWKSKMAAAGSLKYLQGVWSTLTGTGGSWDSFSESAQKELTKFKDERKAALAKNKK